MIDQLRQLIQRYGSGEIDYCEFRNAFVRFMAASDQDPVVERLYNSVEGLCAGFESKHVSELGLKLRLQRLAPASVMVQQNASAFSAKDFVVFMPNIVGVRVVSAGNNAFPIPSSAANQFHDEPKLEETVD